MQQHEDAVLVVVDMSALKVHSQAVGTTAPGQGSGPDDVRLR